MPDTTIVFIGGSLDGEARVFLFPLPSIYRVPVYQHHFGVFDTDVMTENPHVKTETYYLCNFGNSRYLYVLTEITEQMAVDMILTAYVERKKENEDKAQAGSKNVL